MSSPKVALEELQRVKPQILQFQNHQMVCAPLQNRGAEGAEPRSDQSAFLGAGTRTDEVVLMPRSHRSSSRL